MESSIQLFELPYPILHNIITKYLERADLANLCFTSRSCFDVFNSNIFWKAAHKEERKGA